MGWTFHEGATRPSIVKYLLEEGVRPYQVLDHSLVGSTLWAVLQRDDEPPWIFCALLKGHRGYGWGYKDLSESMGPAEENCPLRLLELAPPSTSSFAEGWRDRVRAYHAEQAAQRARIRALEPGMTFALLGAHHRQATVERIDAKGRILARVDDGQIYRIPPRMVGPVVDKGSLCEVSS